MKKHTHKLISFQDILIESVRITELTEVREPLRILDLVTQSWQTPQICLPLPTCGLGSFTPILEDVNAPNAVIAQDKVETLSHSSIGEWKSCGMWRGGRGRSGKLVYIHTNKEMAEHFKVTSQN